MSKNYKIITTLFTVLTVFSACQPKEPTIDTSKPTELATGLDTLSYIYGFELGKRMKDVGLTELDNKMFLTGFQRELEGKKVEISDDVADSYLNAFFNKLTINKLESQINQDTTNEDLKQQLSRLKAKMIAEEKSKILAEEKSKNLEQINKFVGWTFDLDYYHRIEFESETTYRIWQKQLTCGGRGSWSFQNGKIILGSNSSNCSSTRDIAGNKYVKGSKGKLQLVN